MFAAVQAEVLEGGGSGVGRQDVFVPGGGEDRMQEQTVVRGIVDNQYAHGVKRALWNGE
jgi:hypothetical protein